MLKLENIAVFRADKYFKKDIRPMLSQEKDFLKEYNIGDFGALESIINSSVEVPKYLIDLYDLTNEKLKRKSLKIEPEIYITSFPLVSGISKETIIKTEEETKCGDLILTNLTSYQGNIKAFQDIKNENITFLRYLLSHTTLNGENALKLLYRIGNREIKKALNALNLYEEQVLRQAKETDGNLFYLDKNKKREIVYEQFEDYIEYFLSHSDEYNFIWGNITKTTVALLNGCLTSRGYIAVSEKIKEKLINIFTNYITLEELENGVIENHTLDRFMLTKTMEKEVN